MNLFDIFPVISSGKVGESRIFFCLKSDNHEKRCKVKKCRMDTHEERGWPAYKGGLERGPYWGPETEPLVAGQGIAPPPRSLLRGASGGA